MFSNSTTIGKSVVIMLKGLFQILCSPILKKKIFKKKKKTLKHFSSGNIYPKNKNEDK